MRCDDELGWFNDSEKLGLEGIKVQNSESGSGQVSARIRKVQSDKQCDSWEYISQKPHVSELVSQTKEQNSIWRF